MAQRWVVPPLDKLIGEKAYDSDGLDARMAAHFATEVITPHRRGRKRNATRDGRCLRRWRIERVFALLGNYRLENCLSFLNLAVAPFFLKHL